MKNLVFAMIYVLVFTVAACGGDGGKTVTTSDVVEDGQTADGLDEFGCQTADDCMGKQEPGDCQKVACVENTCKIVPDTSINGQVCVADDPCQQNTTCFQGMCQGVAKECSDGNACTNDTCDQDTGECAYENNNLPCDDGNPCTQGDACGEGACQGGENVCECTVDADCESYDDGNPCNGINVCLDGACQVDETTIVDCSGTLVGPCEESYCDEDSGACEFKNRADGAACDAADLCVTNAACDAGECTGEPVKCDDGIKCTDDSCDSNDGCVYTPVANGTECNDGSLCTDNDTCQNGECVGDAVPECDSCDSDEECQPYEDGNACNGTLACLDGQCLVDEGTVVVCDGAADDCEQVKCIPATGECEQSAALDGTPCEDLNSCTESDYCSGGVCKGLPLACDDNNACTSDSCNPDSGCVYEPKTNSCGDGDPCTINDHCDGGQCVGDPNPECQCDTDVDCVEKEDDDLCNGTLVCIDKKCIVDQNTVVDCIIPGLSTCMLSECEPETGACILTQLDDSLDCDDKNACTAGDKCFSGICKGNPKTCDDDNICTNDSCDVNLGCVYSYNSADCDDGNLCTLDDYCAEGTCTGDPNPDCQCQTNADCASKEDGNLCNGTLVCKAYKCQIDPATLIECDKSNDGDCKMTYCLPDSGTCTTADFEDGKPCSDHSVCTQVDVCVAGVCTGSLTLECDSGNPCTNDSCDAQLGCIAVPNTQSCDDGDPCTGGDACSEGVCQPGNQDLCGDTCIPDWTLVCGGTDSWGNDMGGATDVVDEYACSPHTYTGPEYTYTFTAPYAAEITVSLSGEEAETDLIVLESAGEGCDPDQCRDWHFSKVTFEAEAGQTYYFVVDGYEEGMISGEGDYTISIECQPLEEINCEDGIDEDDDGLTDCDDPDCVGTLACPLPICDPAWSLSCGESDSWSNYGWGSTDVVEAYDCNMFDYSGPEYAYVFVAPVSKSITVTLSEESSETDIHVLTSGDEGTCLPENCIAWGTDEVTFDAVAGDSYYFVIDGWLGDEGSYTITVNCPPDVEGNCEDEIDNDQDGKEDCADEDCAYSPVCFDTCSPWFFPDEVGCGYEEDYYNYSFLSTNKADSYSCTQALEDGPEYVYNFTSPFDAEVTVTLTEETAETDILVVEGDGEDACLTVNCIAADYDSVTFTATAGELYFLVVDGYDGAQGSYHIAIDCQPASEMDCTDGLDDDADGAIDCEDSDCFPGNDCEEACIPDSEDAAEITCDSADAWSTDGDGSADKVESYSCNSYNYEGSEYTYTLTVDQMETVTVVLDNEVDDEDESVELDILVLMDDGLGCNPASCIAYGLTSVTFEADPAMTYYVVVDGYNGAEGYYDLSVTCQ